MIEEECYVGRVFGELMAQGKVQKALRFICHDSSGGVLGLDDVVPLCNSDGEVWHRSTPDLLVDKHPDGKPASILYPYCLINHSLSTRYF